MWCQHYCSEVIVHIGNILFRTAFVLSNVSCFNCLNRPITPITPITSITPIPMLKCILFLLSWIQFSLLLLSGIRHCLERQWRKWLYLVYGNTSLCFERQWRRRLAWTSADPERHYLSMCLHSVHMLTALRPLTGETTASSHYATNISRRIEQLQWRSSQFNARVYGVDSINPKP